MEWTPWATEFWPGYSNAPWDPPGTDPEPFPARAGYSSLAFLPAEESASGKEEVAVMFEATGEIGPLRVIRFLASGPHAGTVL